VPLASEQFRRWSLAIIIGVVLLIRLPFLNQAIQGDDPKFIWIAQHALIEPGHPSHTQYIFQGEPVDMRGHPHPPLNAWVLSALINTFGDVREVPFHAFYLLFSLIAALSMYALAKRWAPDHALEATLLFLAVPAFVVNGNSFESDVPFLAFWMAAFALFTRGYPLLAVVPFCFAAMMSYQAVFATPILWVYCWRYARDSRTSWATAATPVFVVIAYQVWERMTGGTMPGLVLAGYFTTYGLQQIGNKLRNAAALTAHLGWMMCPLLVVAAFHQRYVLIAGAVAAAIGAYFDPNPLFWLSFGIGAMVVVAQFTTRVSFLRWWILLFFAYALAVFFAGSARYLLPLGAPLAILTARAAPRFVLPGVALNLLLGLGLAWVNYQHWDGYRTLTASLARDIGQKRVWVNGEWTAFYMEAEGALALTRKQTVQKGEWVASSALGFPIQVTAPMGAVTEREIRPTLPLRLIGLNSKSGYSTASLGLRPFDISSSPIDKVRIDAVLDRKPTLEWLPMNAPEALTQLVSGMYQQEGSARWMSGKAVILLKEPAEPRPVQVDLYIPDQAPGRTVVVLLDGNEIARKTIPGPGMHSIRSVGPVKGGTLTISIDKTFQVAGDFRELGAVLLAAGFPR